jgi:hypothetical protein
MSNLTKNPLANLEAAEEFKLIVLERVNERAKKHADQKTSLHYQAQQLLGSWAFKHLPKHILDYCTYEMIGVNQGTIEIDYPDACPVIIELIRSSSDAVWERSNYFVSCKGSDGQLYNDGSLSTPDLIEAIVWAIEEFTK